MNAFQDISPEQLATLFFHYREALAPDFECGREENNSGIRSWEAAPSNERKLQVAAARLVLLDLAAGSRSEINEPAGSSWRGGTEGKECGC
jgi:hypothetical protein